MHYNYLKIIEELREKAKVHSDDIFEYQFSSLSEVFERYFQFCQENLSEESSEYKIQPAKFYYRNQYEVNARAVVQNDYFIIGINMGTIKTLYDIFYEHNDIFDSSDILSDKYNKLAEQFDVPIGYLMFQSAILFTFYHERAHLIQKSMI